MTTGTPTPDRETAGLDGSIDLLELFTLFVVEWRRFLITFLILFALGAAEIYSITPLYEASASLLPQSHEDSNNLSSLFSGRSPGDVFLGLLSSRSVADDVIARANLLQLYRVKSYEDARSMLAARTVSTIGRDTLVVIKVRDADAQVAMRVTNAYLEALQNQREKMLQEESDAQNKFFQKQMALQADALAAAEQDLQKLQEHTGLVQPELQTSTGITAIAGVRAQITTLQVQLSALLLGESEQAPQVKALRAQIAQLENQEAAMESAAAGTGAGAAAAARQMPGMNLEYARKQREVKYHEALFNSISTQYETASLREGYAGAPFVIIDRAIAPEHKAFPPRRILLIVVAAFSAFFGIVFVAVLLLWRKLQADPDHRAQFATIRSSFRFTR